MGRWDDPGTSPLAAYVRAQVEEVFAGAPHLPEASAIHRTRVALRRLRSVLRVYGPMLSLEAEEITAADEQLRWFAGLLGEVRDRQVQRVRFAAALAELPADDVVGPVATRIDDTLHAEQVRAEEEIAQAMAAERCQALRHMLGTWRHHPPVGEADPGELRSRARKAARKARRRLRSVWPDGSDAELHRARKAAKRARYAAEVLEPLGRGTRQRKRFKRLQVVLGDQQDAVVAAATLRRLASTLGDDESAFTYGLLYAQERETAERLRRVVWRVGGVPG